MTEDFLEQPTASILPLPTKEVEFNKKTLDPIEIEDLSQRKIQAVFKEGNSTIEPKSILSEILSDLALNIINARFRLLGYIMDNIFISLPPGSRQENLIAMLSDSCIELNKLFTKKNNRAENGWRTQGQQKIRSALLRLFKAYGILEDLTKLHSFLTHWDSGLSKELSAKKDPPALKSTQFMYPFSDSSLPNVSFHIKRSRTRTKTGDDKRSRTQTRADDEIQEKPDRKRLRTMSSSRAAQESYAPIMPIYPGLPLASLSFPVRNMYLGFPPFPYGLPEGHLSLPCAPSFASFQGAFYPFNPVPIRPQIWTGAPALFPTLIDSSALLPSAAQLRHPAPVVSRSLLHMMPSTEESSQEVQSSESSATILGILKERNPPIFKPVAQRAVSPVLIAIDGSPSLASTATSSSRGSLASAAAERGIFNHPNKDGASTTTAFSRPQTAPSPLGT